MGMFTISSRPIAKGTSSSKYFRAGISFCTDKCNVPGSKPLHFNSSFAKLQIVSDKIPHLKGQGAPPNVRQSVMIVSLSSGSCMADGRAVFKWSVPCW